MRLISAVDQEIRDLIQKNLAHPRQHTRSITASLDTGTQGSPTTKLMIACQVPILESGKKAP